MPVWNQGAFSSSASSRISPASISTSSSINSAGRCTVTSPRGVEVPFGCGGAGGGVNPELLPDPELKPDE